MELKWPQNFYHEHITVFTRVWRDIFYTNLVYSATIILFLIATFSTIYLNILRSTYETQAVKLQEISFNSDRLQTILNSNIYSQKTSLSDYENLIQKLIIDLGIITDGKGTTAPVQSDFLNGYELAALDWHDSLKIIVNEFNDISNIRETNEVLINDARALLDVLTSYWKGEKITSYELSSHIAATLLVLQLRERKLSINPKETPEAMQRESAKLQQQITELTFAIESINDFIESPVFKDFSNYIDSQTANVNLNRESILTLYQDLQLHIKNLQSQFSNIQKINTTITKSDINFVEFKYQHDRLLQVVKGQYETANLFYVLSYLLWIVVIICVILSYFTYVNHLSEETERIKKENEELTHSVLSLINEISEYASGNLSRDVTVSSSLTGSIADSINLVIQSMRNIISTIQQHSTEVYDTANTNIEVSNEIQDLAGRQITAIQQSSDKLSSLSVEITRVSSDALNIEQMAMESQKLNKRSSENIGASINSIDFIRSDIQNTSRRLKHLGESSQKIGDIVILLTDIAKQTKLVALNASIRITSEGDSGYGMIGVVEETQKLANLVADSANQASEIVDTIQREMAKTIEAMEQFTAKVVEEYEKAKDAKRELETINTAYDALLVNINDIVHKIGMISEQSQDVSRQVNEIADLSRKISGSIEKSETNSQRLTNTVSLLVKSVSIFTLPSDDATPLIEDDITDIPDL